MLKCFVCIGLLVFKLSLLAQKNLVLIGTYTDTLHAFSFDEKKMTFKKQTHYIGLKNPSYFVVNKKKDKIYVVEENENGNIGSLAFDKKTLSFSFLNRISTQGAHPCYVDISPLQNYFAVANYTGGNWLLGKIDLTGALSSNTLSVQEKGSSKHRQQESSHVHCILFHSNNNFFSTANLGTDKISTYKISKTKSDSLKIRLVYETKLESGSGPRHLIFNNANNFLYVINELSGKIDFFKVQKMGLLKIQTIVSDSVSALTKGGADIHFSPDGKFLYTSNRVTSNSISIFKVNKNGKLSFVSAVATDLHPRNFILSPSGKFLFVANKDSDNIVVYKRNIKNGLIKRTSVFLSIKSPVCLKWVNL